MWTAAWVVWAAAAARGLPTDDAATQRCLDGLEPCAADDGACDGASLSRACLASRVPFRAPYARVRCCFRCCLRHWIRRYGLDAHWATARADGVGDGLPIDEPLLGHDGAGTLAFAARRVAKRRMPWARAAWTAEMAAPKNATARDRRETDAFLWSAARTAGAGAGAGAGVGTWNGGWIELHFGDACGERVSPGRFFFLLAPRRDPFPRRYTRKSPWGTYVGLTLASLERFFLPEVVGDAREDSATLVLAGVFFFSLVSFGSRRLEVTTSDCDLPAKWNPFSNASRLLDSPRLRAWYASNPSDGVSRAPHPKLRAAAMGVRDRAAWVRQLDGREARAARPVRLVCCARPAFLPGRGRDRGAPRDRLHGVGADAGPRGRRAGPRGAAAVLLRRF